MTRKFDEQDVLEAIQKVQAFEPDTMGYIDFLEALIRMTLAFPFTDEELADLINLESKMMYFINKLDLKYKHLSNAFNKRFREP